MNTLKSKPRVIKKSDFTPPNPPIEPYMNCRQTRQQKPTQPQRVVHSLEKSRRRIYALIEKVSQLKSLVSSKEGIPMGVKIEIKKTVDRVLDTLNNELVIVAEEMQRARGGISVAGERKRVKRRVRKLEEEIDGILDRIVNKESGRGILLTGSTKDTEKMHSKTPVMKERLQGNVPPRSKS